MTEKIVIGADHAGFEMKEKIAGELRAMGFEVDDVGAASTESTDYPIYAHKVAEEVASGEVPRGVLLCGTELGMSYAANRHPGVRAAVVWNTEVAKMSRLHNDANVLVLPARVIDDGTASEILKVWLATPFEGGRHERRVAAIEVPE